MPEDFEPRFKIEEQPDLIDKYTVRQDSYLWIDNHWLMIGKRYSRVATHKISEDVIKWLEDHSRNKKQIQSIKEDESKRIKKK
jgi:hypothetical protein